MAGDGCRRMLECMFRSRFNPTVVREAAEDGQSRALELRIDT